MDSKGIIITTNNISSGLDFQEIEKYVKNSLSSDTDKVSSPRLPQLKLYLKIVSILFISEKTSNHVSLDKIKNVLKNNHLFNDIVLISKPRIIKVSPKSNMDIIWIDIWDTQNGLNAKKVINQRFNIGNYIATVWGANMNLGVPQCKNCWKWGHMAGVCRIQGAKCVKCNGPHLTKHYCYFAWYYKASKKTNLPRLKTKKSKPCPHSFKCLNCKDEHQANSYECPFWKHCFNKKWHSKEYMKIWDNRKNSTCSAMNSSSI